MTAITPRESFIAALEHQTPAPGSRAPHWELEFFLTMEAFGKVHPQHRDFRQWQQMSVRERELQIQDVAGLYLAVAARYEHAGIYIKGPRGWDEPAQRRLFEVIREQSGMQYLLLVGGDSTYGLPGGADMTGFVMQFADEPEKMKQQAQDGVMLMLERAERIQRWGTADGFVLTSDYCFNRGPFFPPEMFAEFVTPYLAQLIGGYREAGFYTIKHTDGNIMPILDQLIACRPHALHSLDPQGGVDIAEVKRLTGDKICLVGNVNCALMQTGSESEVVESARYALKHGMPGGGYIFSTSNCIYSGMDLARYELIHKIWSEEARY